MSISQFPLRASTLAPNACAPLALPTGVCVQSPAYAGMDTVCVGSIAFCNFAFGANTDGLGDGPFT